MEKVAATMKQVHEFVTESDEYYQSRIGTKAAVEPEPEPTIDIDEDQNDEHPVGDIPF